MRTRTGAPPLTSAPARILASPRRGGTATAVRPPGLESVSAHGEEDVWLQEALLGPYSEDILTYLDLARSTGGPVLDLGTGGGRLAVPFAQHGFLVEAVDSDRGSLKRLHAWAARIGPAVRAAVTATQADITCLRLTGTYGLALLAGAMVSAVPPELRPALLSEVASRLAPGGRLALDYTIHCVDELADDPHRSWCFTVPRFDGVRERVEARQSFDLTRRTEKIVYRVERSGGAGRTRRTVVVTNKWLVDQVGLDSALRSAGLCIEELRRQQLDRRTHSVLLVCHPHK